MGLYSAAHVEPKGAGDARPTAVQIVRDERLEDKLKGKVMVITGATSGIGLETARALSTTGATLYLPVRDLKKGETVLGPILEAGRVSLVEMDVASFASVRAAAADILSASKHQVNVLINNAGVMGLQDLQITDDGREKIFATNYLGHFLLFQLLKSALLASSEPDFNSRVVNVSSSGHRARGLNESDNYDFQKGGYEHGLAYCNSKLAQVYMSNEIDRRYGKRGLHAFSLHPGNINTDIARNLGSEFVAQIMANEYVVKVLKSSEQGAATTVIAAIGRDWEGTGGRYLEDCEEAKRGEDDGEIFGAGYVSHTYNPQEESRLWGDSLKILSITDSD
nr:ww domain-containing oxidoreductase [Quercus suber]